MAIINTFTEWYKIIKESEASVAEPTVASVKTKPKETSRNTSTDIMSDVDDIINSLETLAAELTEELESVELNNLCDSIFENDATDFIKSWLISIKAAKSQKKVNKIKLNSSDLEFAAKKAEGEKRKDLEERSSKVKQQANDLQKMVDDKFSGKGAMVDARLSKEKIKGQLELIKRTSGMEDNPNKKADLKSKMQELSNKYKEEQSAIAELEDKNKEAIEKEKERMKKEAETSKDKNPKEEPKSEETPKEEPKSEETPKEEPKAEENPKEDKIASIENDIKLINKNIKEEEGRVANLNSQIKELESEKSKSTDTESYDLKIAKLKKDVEDSKEDIKSLNKEEESKKSELKKLSNTQESLYNRAISTGLNELALEINSKQDWQIQSGTILGEKYENLIKTAEFNTILNENKYVNNSIKDKFSNLL